MGADHSLGSGVVDSDSLGSGVVDSDSLGSGVIAANRLGSRVVTHDPTHSLGSGVVDSDSLGSGVLAADSLGSGVGTHDPTHSLGSGVGTHDPTHSLGSGVIAADGLGSGVGTHDPTHSLGSGVGASDRLGSGVVTHDPTHSLGSGVIAADGLGSGVGTHDPTHSLGSGVDDSDSLGSGVGASDSLGSGVRTHDPTHSLGSGVIAADSLGSGVVTHDPTHSLGSGVVAGDRLGSREGLGVKSGTIWKVRMLSVRRPGNAGDTTSLVATENQEPRLEADRVAPNANGADRGRPSRSGARGQEETDSEDTDDSEHHTQELRAYSDDGAESELGEPEGHGRSRPDAASRGESRQLVPEVGLYQRLERRPSLERPRSVMSLDGLEAYTHRTQRVSGPYDGGMSQLEIRSRPWSLDGERRAELDVHHDQTFGEMADGGPSAAAPEADYLLSVSGRPAATDEYVEGHRLEIHTRELEHGIQMGWIEDSRPHHPLNRVIREDWRFPGVVGLASVQPAEEPRNRDDNGRPLNECPRRIDDGASWGRPPAASEDQRGYQLGRPSVIRYGPDVLATMRAGGRGEDYPDQHWAEPTKHQPSVVSAPTVHRDEGYQIRCYRDAGSTTWQTEEKRCWDREEAIRSGDVYAQVNWRSQPAAWSDSRVDIGYALEQQMEGMRLQPQPRDERPAFQATSSHWEPPPDYGDWYRKPKVNAQNAPADQARQVEQRSSCGVGPYLRGERSQPVGDTSSYHSSDRPRGGSGLDRRAEALAGGRAGTIPHPALDTRRHQGVELGGIVQRGPALGRSVWVDPNREPDGGLNRMMSAGSTRPVPARHPSRGEWPENPRAGGAWAADQTRPRLPRTPVKMQDVRPRPVGSRNVHYWDEDPRVRGTMPMDQQMGLGTVAQRHFDMSRYPSLSPPRWPAGRTIHDEEEDSDFEPVGSLRRGYPDRRAKKPKTSTRDRKEMKLEKFDGKTRIESFLAKFEICSRHNGWSEADRIDNLQCSLGGDAAQILWDMGAEGVKTSKDLILQLETRYGSAHQTALYRTQLNYRRRRKGETLGDLVNDVRRLIVLAYPGPSSAMRETFACEAFLEALNDRDLALKIREKEPSTLEQACQMAMRLEAYAGGQGALERDRQVSQTRQVTESSDGPETSYDRCAEFLRDWSQLQQEKFEKFMKEVKSIMAKQDQRAGPPASECSIKQPVPEGPLPKKNWFRRRDNANNRRESDRSNQGCYNCGEGNHFIARCPYPRVGRNDSNTPEGTQRDVPASVTNHIKGEVGVYLEINIGGRNLHALLDTGSDISLVPRDVVPMVTLRKTVQVLQAANGTEIEVLGETELTMNVADLELSCDCLVVRDVSDVILGLDWMTKHVDTLSLKKKSIVVQGRTLPIVEHPKDRSGRTLVCDRAVTTPPPTEAKSRQSEDRLLGSWTHVRADGPKVLMSGRLASEPAVHDGPVVPCIPHQARPPRRWRGPDRFTYNRIVRTGLRCRGVASVNHVQLGNVQPRIDSESGMQSIHESQPPTGAKGQASALNNDPKSVDESTKKRRRGRRPASKRKHRIDIVERP